ncbi:MAG: flagellar basal body rod protein FlgC [Pseudomonadota bacterium]
MSDLMRSMIAATSGMDSQTTRLRLISENIANIDTPGYRRKTISFEEVRAQSDARAVIPGQVRLDRSELERVYEPANPLANEDGYFDGSNVDLIVEMADARESRRSYEASLRMFEQSRGMLNSLFELMRR